MFFYSKGWKNLNGFRLLRRWVSDWWTWSLHDVVMKTCHQANMPVLITCCEKSASGLNDVKEVSAKVIVVFVTPINWAVLLRVLLLDDEDQTVRPPTSYISTATGKRWRPLNFLCVSCLLYSSNEDWELGVEGVKSVMWGQSSDPANTSRADLISQCTADSSVMRSAPWPPWSERTPVVISSPVAYGVSITWCQLSTCASLHDPKPQSYPPPPSTTPPKKLKSQGRTCWVTVESNKWANELGG